MHHVARQLQPPDRVHDEQVLMVVCRQAAHCEKLVSTEGCRVFLPPARLRAGAAIAQPDRTVSAGGHCRIVRHHENGQIIRLLQRAKKVKNLLRGDGIQFPVGSSASNTRGRWAMATAMAARCCCPPDN